MREIILEEETVKLVQKIDSLLILEFDRELVAAEIKPKRKIVIHDPVVEDCLETVELI